MSITIRGTVYTGPKSPAEESARREEQVLNGVAQDLFDDAMRYRYLRDEEDDWEGLYWMTEGDDVKTWAQAMNAEIDKRRKK